MINLLEQQVIAKMAQANQKRVIKPLNKSILHDLLLLSQQSVEQLETDQWTVWSKVVLYIVGILVCRFDEFGCIKIVQEFGYFSTFHHLTIDFQCISIYFNEIVNRFH